MLLHRFFKNKSVFFVYLTSNLLLLIIPAVCLLANSFATVRMRQEALQESDRQLSVQFAQGLDNGFEKMDDIFQTLFRDTNVSKLTYRDENLNNYDAYTVWRSPRPWRRCGPLTA